MHQQNLPTPWLNPVFEHLLHTYQKGRFAHGLLFTGSAGLGKFKLASRVANYLLCSEKTVQGACGQCHACQLYAAHNHLDFHLLESESNKAIGVDQVRDLIDRLNERPHLGDNKVVVIKDAQLLTVAAANALLKTLEEPQGNSYLILLARSHHQLMPTLISRLQHSHIHSPNDADLLQWLAQQGFSIADIGLLRQFQNCPLVLLNHLQAVQEGSAGDERRNCVEGLFSLMQQPESLFEFSKFLAQDVTDRLQLLFFLLHDIHKLKLTGRLANNEAIYAFALPQLQIWSAQINLKKLRILCQSLLRTRASLIAHSGLKKELLISALLIQIKNEFKEHPAC